MFIFMHITFKTHENIFMHRTFKTHENNLRLESKDYKQIKIEYL